MFVSTRRVLKTVEQLRDMCIQMLCVSDVPAASAWNKSVDYAFNDPAVVRYLSDMYDDNVSYEHIRQFLVRACTFRCITVAASTVYMRMCGRLVGTMSHRRTHQTRA